MKEKIDVFILFRPLVLQLIYTSKNDKESVIEDGN
jgi:hypothetical protein